MGVIREFEKDVTVGRIRSLDAILSDSIASSRLNALTFASFAILALVLAGVGVYGVLAFVVRHRTREIGLLMAIGAAPQRIARSIIGDALRLVALGLTAAALCGSYLPARRAMKLDPMTALRNE